MPAQGDVGEIEIGRAAAQRIPDIVTVAVAIFKLHFGMRRQRTVSRVGHRVETEVQPEVIAEVGTTGRSRRVQAPGRRRHLRAGWTDSAGAICQRLAVFYVAAYDLGGEVTAELEAGVGAGQGPADDRLAVHGDGANFDIFRGGRAF